MNHMLNCRYEIKWGYDPHKIQKLLREAWKIQVTGVNSVEVLNFSGLSTKLLKLRTAGRMKASLEYLLFEQKR